MLFRNHNVRIRFYGVKGGGGELLGRTGLVPGIVLAEGSGLRD